MDLSSRIMGRLGSRRSFRILFLVLLLAFLIPILGVAVVISLRAAEATRTQIEATAIQQAHDIVSVLDREMNGNKGSLIALASAQSLQGADLREFYEHAKLVSRLLDNQIVLTDIRTRRQIINTDYDWGSALGPGLSRDQLILDPILSTSGAVVSDLIYGPLTKRFVVAVTTAVRVAGEPRYLLSVTVPALEIADLVAHAQLSKGFLTTVVDKKGVIISRSAGDYVGKNAPQANDPSGAEREVYSAINLDGRPTTFFRKQSSLTGWVVLVGVPQDILNAAQSTAMRNIAWAGFVLFVIGSFTAYFGGNVMSEHWGALGVNRQPTRAEFQILFDSATNGVLLIDSDGTIVLANAWMEEKFGYSREEIVGRPLELLLPDRSGIAPLGNSNIAQLLQLQNSAQGRELTGRRKDGTEFPVEIEFNFIDTKTTKFVMATVVDITLRKEAAQRLSAAIEERDFFRRQLLQAQENERLRLARELHDETGQVLTAALLEINRLELAATLDSKNRLSRLRVQMEGMGKALHRIAHALRPAALDELGVSAAIATHIEEWSEQTGIETDFECDIHVLESAPDNIRTTIYRVVQEALTNVAKHGTGATIVSLVVERTGDILHLTIEDDGAGFEVNNVRSVGIHGGLGIAGMEERVALFGGTFEIESTVGFGTTLYIRLPIAAKKVASA